MERPEQPVTADETLRALRLLRAVLAVALATYAFVAFFVITPHRTLTAWGRSEVNNELIARGGRRMHFATFRAWHEDRTERWGDRPVLWILGSSITREAIDADLLRQELRARKQDWGVEKLAFERGAPIFSWGMLDGMDIRPGDRVLTSVHYDNFRRDWLAYHGGFPSYMNHLLRPRHLFRIAELPWADRLEYSLASTPPMGFHQSREPFRDGLEAWIRYQTGRVDNPPEIRPPLPHSDREYVTNFREQARADLLPMTDAEMRLEPGQCNWDALLAWEAEVKALGAEPWVLHFPSSPEYYERFEQGAYAKRFHSAMEANFDRYVRMSPQVQRNYSDYKHLNLRGRPIMTRQVAHLLGTSPLGAPPNRPRLPETP